MPAFNGVRVVAGFEAAKGCLVLLAGVGLLALVHQDVQSVADALVERSHLNPASRYPRIFVRAAGAVTDVQLWLLAVGAAAYAAVRFVEAYGLWRHRSWAEWFAAISAGIYVPIEIYELSRSVTWPKIAAFVVNSVIVVYMSYALLQSRRTKSETAA